MHPHNPRSEAREVDGVRFKRVGKWRWCNRETSRTSVEVYRPSEGSKWLIAADAYRLMATVATKFAQAIGAAAKLADELNERKE